MNRRKKKKQQNADYIGLIKQKWSSIDWSKIKDKIQQNWNRLPKLHQRALMVLAPIVLLLLLIPFPDSKQEATQPTPQRVEIDINTSGLSEQTIAGETALTSKEWQEYEVKSGDTLAQVFRSNGLPMADLNALVKVEGNDKPLSYIKQGQLVRYKLTEEGKLDILQLEKSGHSVMFFRLSDGGFGRSK